MLRTLMISAFVIAAVGVCCASQPAPFRTPKQGIAKGNTGHTGKDQGTPKQDGNNSSDMSLTVIQAPAPVADADPGQAQENTEIQRKLEFFTGLLVLVGFLQVATMVYQARLLSGTLDEIHIQAGHMETQTKILGESVASAQKSADAAEMSAKAAMGVAIPTLAVQSFQISPHGFDSVAVALKFPEVEILLRNHGQSTAFMKSYSIMITCDEIDSLPTVPYYEQVYSSEELVIEGGGLHGIGGPLAYLRAITDEDVQDLLNRTRHLTIYGIFSYGNIFDSSVRDLKFCKRLEDYGTKDQWRSKIVNEERLRRYINT